MENRVFIKESKDLYISPIVEFMEFEVEVGFAASGGVVEDASFGTWNGNFTGTSSSGKTY